MTTEKEMRARWEENAKQDTQPDRACSVGADRMPPLDEIVLKNLFEARAALEQQMRTVETHIQAFQSLRMDAAKVRPMPETVAVTDREGGQWLHFQQHSRENVRLVHSIKFADGRIWDAISGWR